MARTLLSRLQVPIRYGRDTIGPFGDLRRGNHGATAILVALLGNNIDRTSRSFADCASASNHRGYCYDGCRGQSFSTSDMIKF